LYSVAVSNSESFMDTHSTVIVNFCRSVVVQFSCNIGTKLGYS